MKRDFIPKGVIEYGELRVTEQSTGKSFTLTQKNKLFYEKYYSVSRWIASQEVEFDDIPEKDFYVYEISYIINGRYYVSYIDEIRAVYFINSHLSDFLRGTVSPKTIAQFLSSIPPFKKFIRTIIRIKIPTFKKIIFSFILICVYLVILIFIILFVILILNTYMLK